MQGRWLAVAFVALMSNASLGPDAVAADLGGSRSKVVSAASPDPALPAAWSGIYFGVHGGYGWTDVGWQDAVNGSHDGEGGLAGGQIGYNIQTGRLVFGVEADISASWIEGANGNGCCAHTFDMLYSLRGRAGLTGFDNRTLFYLTAGGAWADVEYTSSSGRFSDMQFGWVFGGGVEHALTQNLTARIEYLYYDFDAITAAPGTLAAGATSLDPSMHTVRFGLNFKF
jgi:outer membrane immunogenic protein